jgi:pantoate--beta-alanine ligase
MNILAGETRAREIQKEIAERIAATPGAELDYVAVVDWKTLLPVEPLTGRLLIALAVRFGMTRLIDNVLVTVPVTIA